MEVIAKWISDNEGDISCIASFMEIDRKKVEENADDIFGDDRIACFGYKDMLKIDLEGLQDSLNKDENEHVDWIFGSNEDNEDDESECICDECKNEKNIPTIDEKSDGLDHSVIPITIKMND